MAANKQETPGGDKEQKIRDCSDYYEEYKACKSLSNKIQTYYAFGYYKKKSECQSWKEMFNLCKKCTLENDEEAKQTLVAMEKANADDVIRNRTNIWTYRDEPPPMWHFPGKLAEDFAPKPQPQPET
uniref:UPF0545 protein C22orf39 homolog n=1 Tax=Styela clava TaxID=7725 RepID=UPI00193A50C1|nr:UPF0545 protein C22orf39 homolog [Styela clava]